MVNTISHDHIRKIFLLSCVNNDNILDNRHPTYLRSRSCWPIGMEFFLFIVKIYIDSIIYINNV